jgi:hypothetical protein
VGWIHNLTPETRRSPSAADDVTPHATNSLQSPVITSQPANATVTVGGPATLTVSATGDAPFRYQCYFNTNTLLASQTNATLSFTITSTNDAGGYPGHNYQLQYRDSLLNGTWQNIGVPDAGANAPITLTHTGGATAQQRFCRVAVDWQKLDRKSAAAAFLPQKDISE